MSIMHRRKKILLQQAAKNDESNSEANSHDGGGVSHSGLNPAVNVVKKNGEGVNDEGSNEQGTI